MSVSIRIRCENCGNYLESRMEMHNPEDPGIIIEPCLTCVQLIIREGIEYFLSSMSVSKK
jgi:hypothetical protein